MKKTPFFALLAGYAAMRVGELILSRRHEKQLDAENVPRARERGFPIMVAAHTVPFVLAPIELFLRDRYLPRNRTLSRIGELSAWPAPIVLGGALALRGWVIRTLSSNWNVRIHGGPEMRVVTAGPYRWVRHPNYSAVIAEVTALPLAGGAVFTSLIASALNALALAHRIHAEEAVLKTHPAWTAEMSHKPRFIPRLRP